MSENHPVQCEFCGFEQARIRLLTRSYGEGSELLIIENVPVISCPKCGESYLTADTMHEIERLKLHRHTIAEGRRVEVVKFARGSRVA